MATKRSASMDSLTQTGKLQHARDRVLTSRATISQGFEPVPKSKTTVSLAVSLGRSAQSSVMPSPCGKSLAKVKTTEKKTFALSYVQGFLVCVRFDMQLPNAVDRL